MRFIFLILSFFNSTPFASVDINDFNNNIHQGYEEYEMLSNESNEYYTLEVAWGLNKDKVNYSIYFYNENPRALDLIVVVDDKKYVLPKNERYDIAVEAFSIKDASSLKILIFDKDFHVYTTKELPIANTKDEFLNKVSDLQYGLQKGLAVTNLKSYRVSTNYSIVIFALFSIIVFLITTIVVIIITKKGVFNENNSGIVRYRNPIVINPDKIIETDYIIETDPYENESTEPQIVYSRMKHYDYDDDDFSDFDVSDYLSSKGFNTNYIVLSENEKNLIMLELMRLRDEKMITFEQYNYEVIKLWS